ncbi:MAG: tRNA (cytidine(34)-2'-O)-methyltransferase [Planctomycetes bacterium]|nr:tRNA (cytidine(34)-2'-O)-methyltransferase [Planctomycetota bacterium]
MLHVALYQPKIPPNTGNVSRQCVGMGARLHLIGPCGFDLSDTSVKRAGLDYWQDLDLAQHESPEAFLDWLGDRNPWVVTTRATARYDRVTFADEDVLLFGNETTGLPDAWHARWPGRAITIPMPGPVRNYNLSNSVAIVLAQAMSTAGLYR